jgi:hypothetical protein
MKFLPDKTRGLPAPNWISGPYRICQSWSAKETQFTATKAGKFIAITRAPKDDADLTAAARVAAADACRKHAET